MQFGIFIKSNMKFIQRGRNYHAAMAHISDEFRLHTACIFDAWYVYET